MASSSGARLVPRVMASASSLAPSSASNVAPTGGPGPGLASVSATSLDSALSGADPGAGFELTEHLGGSVPIVHVDSSHITDGMGASSSSSSSPGGKAGGLARRLGAVEWGSGQPVLLVV